MYLQFIGHVLFLPAWALKPPMPSQVIHCTMLSISIFHILVAKSYSQQAGYVLALSKRTGINSPWPLTQGVLDTLVNHGLPYPHAELVLQDATPWAFAFRVP